MYQLADQVNGLFGEIYASIEEAEAALETLVLEHLDGEKEVVLIEIEEAAVRNCRDPLDLTEAELSALAGSRIRNFHSIEEVLEANLNM